MLRHLRLPFLLLLFVVLASCRETRSPSLNREDLFELAYGKMEDEVEMFFADGPIDQKTNLVMRDGLFRLGSAYGNKIMEFTSYGDLISLIYNPDENPVPVLLESRTSPDRFTNRQAVEFPFISVGEIAVAADGSLLVEDRVPDRVSEYDEELAVELNRIVIRFDAAGNQVDYLGQEGVGGTYLPYINRIDTTQTGDIVVTTIAPPRTIVFWYSSDGTLLRRIDIAPPNYPVAADQPATVTLDSIQPDKVRRRLYAKFDYYVSNPQSGPDSFSRIYWLDIADGVYGGFLDVPQIVSRGAQSRGQLPLYHYEFLGTAPGDTLFLLGQEDESHSELLILSTSGRVMRRRTIELDYAEVVFRDLSISDTGILTGLLASRDSAKVVWWRTDRLIPRRQR